MKRQSISPSFDTTVFENLENRRLFSITTAVVAVPITSAEITADPTLANFNTYDIQVTLSKGERWVSADMDAELTSGSFYNVSSANHGANNFQSNLWSLIPNMTADTAVGTSGFGTNPVILGTFMPEVAGNGIFTNTSTNVTWGALSDTGTGTFSIARLTVSKTANGDIVGDDATASNPNVEVPWHLSVINGQILTTSGISGTVFSDGNVDGADDNGEGGMAGVTVYLDKNQNGKLDTGEKKLVTDSSGNYDFTELTPGTYYVRQVTPAGYRLTAPSKTDYVVGLGQGVNGTGKNFGDTTRALVSGTVFNDANSNKKFDTSTEKGLVGFTVWIDLNNNGKLDSGDESVLTDANGNWSFGNIVHGTYTVHISAKTGYKNTTPSSFSIKLASAQVSTEHFFGVHKT